MALHYGHRFRTLVISWARQVSRNYVYKLRCQIPTACEYGDGGKGFERVSHFTFDEVQQSFTFPVGELEDVNSEPETREEIGRPALQEHFSHSANHK